MNRIQKIKQSLLSNDKKREQYRLWYATDGPSLVMQMEGLTRAEFDELAKVMDWVRPAIKVPAAYQQVKTGKKTEQDFPNLCFRQLYKQKPGDIRGYLDQWYMYDYMFTDLEHMLRFFPSFQDKNLTHDGQVKMLRRLARIEPTMKPAVNKLLTEYRKA